MFTKQEAFITSLNKEINHLKHQANELNQNFSNNFEISKFKSKQDQSRIKWSV